MKALILSLTSFALIVGSLANAANKQSNGFLVEIRNPNSKHIQKLVHSGKMELLKLSFGTFGYVAEGKAADALNYSTVMSLSNRRAIGSIQPNYIYSGLEVAAPQDRNWSTQWGFQNNGNNNWMKGPKGEDIHAMEAWEITKGSHDVVVAVIDSGVMVNHPDLEGNIYTNLAEQNGINGIDDDGNGYIDDVHGYDFGDKDPETEDGVGHGTHVAGLIGARHNTIGIAGVMDNVKILPLKFLNKENKGDTKDAILAIDYAIKMNANIINASWGSHIKSDVLEKAIQAASEKGILFVAAAGNSKEDNHKNPIYPASYTVSNIIAVGATNGAGRKAGFSNYGKSLVHIFAPGVYSISITPDGKNLFKSGTSSAAPLVSGALGLLLSKYPNIKAEEAKERLMKASDNKETFTEFGLAGRLNIYRLLTEQ